MKKIGQVLLVSAIVLLMGCEKEVPSIADETNLSEEENTELSTYFTTKKKKLKATQLLKETPFTARSEHTSLVFKKRMWVLAGFDGEHKNDIWYSGNGFSWTAATQNGAFPARHMHASAVFRGRMWIAGGDDIETTGLFDQMNDVWYSSDGKVWNQATADAAFSPRYDHTLTRFKGALWLIGGRAYDGVSGTEDLADIWKSFNGKHWFLVDDDAPFGGRGGHSTLVHNKKLWVIGGASTEGWKNDVWYSDDGVIWTEATADAAFSPRSGHQVVSYGKFMWLTAGRFGANYKNDIWCSANGSTWNEVEASPEFPGRDGHSSVRFKNKLWVINGKDGSSLADLWFFK